MKVLLVADILRRDFDGCNRTLFQLLDRSLDKLEIEYYCVASVFENFPLQILHQKVPHLTLPFNKDYQMAIPLFIDAKVSKVFSEFKPEIVHITTPSLLGNYMLRVAKKHKIPVTTIYHTNFVSYVDYYINTKTYFGQKAYNFILKKYVSFYNQCNKILSPTKSMKEHLINLGVKKDILEIMSRGINKDLFFFKNQKSNRIKEFFNNDYKNILFASRLVWEKNLKIIIEIYNYCNEKQLNFNFIIVGDGVAYTRMKDAMPKALFLGEVNQNDLCDIYNDADLFLFPSVTETFGNVVLEAMTCGLPVVASMGGSNTDVVDDGINGILVSEKDIAGYINAFNHILHEQNYPTFQKEALHNKLSKSWGEIYYEFVDRLNEVLLKPKSQSALL